MKVFTYPMSGLLPDYWRAAAGFAVTAAPLPWLAPTPAAFTIAALLAVAFAIYGISTFGRQKTKIEIDDAGITSDGPRRKQVLWNDLQEFELRYYSVRRDRQRGWMQLRLSSDPGGRVTVDSALDGFSDVVRFGLDAAARKNLALTDVTAANVRALGLEPYASRTVEAAG